MHLTGMSLKAIRQHMSYHFISRLERKHEQIMMSKTCQRSGRLKKTSDRDNMEVQRLDRRMRFGTSTVLKNTVFPIFPQERYKLSKVS